MWVTTSSFTSFPPANDTL
ncbi:hypothetical protein OIU76_007747 [Salix suchowensis]|nr:hypothetical protein OIU76_007747 [Salix suchowensis]